MGINYLLGVGPMSTGEFTPEIYQNMMVVASWMKLNRRAVRGTKPLPASESASVPATASPLSRYLFVLPQFKEGGAYDKDLLPPVDMTLALKGVSRPSAVKLLSNGQTLKYDYADNVVTVLVPASVRTKLVDVVQIDLTQGR